MPSNGEQKQLWQREAGKGRGMEPGKHIVGGGPNPETGKNIVVIEDATLSQDALRLECAWSDRDFANLLASLYSSVTVRPKKGHPRNEMHFYVPPYRFDETIALFEDDSVEPMTNRELASEIMRATRRNN